MRSFVAASCCLIVGLEILIGVPVAVCLGFLCFSSEVSGTYVAESQMNQPIYAPVAYPTPALPAGQPVPTFDPYVAAPPHPSLCPAPMFGTGYSVAAIHDPPGEPTSDSAAAPERESSEPDGADFAASPQTVEGAGQRLRLSIEDDQQLVARVGLDESCTQSTGGSSHSEEPTLLTSVRQTAQLLYRQADRREEETDFGEADRLRSLARELRQEAERLTHTAEGVPQLRESHVSELPPGLTVGPPPRG